jgi:dihydroorotate dehydrogenase (NAD+) catalytic subunit
MVAGASAVQVGTATFVQPTALITIIDELAAYCAENSVAHISDIVGSVVSDGVARFEAEP